jgi:hypothetical protein
MPPERIEKITQGWCNCKTIAYHGVKAEFKRRHVAAIQMAIGLDARCCGL